MEKFQSNRPLLNESEQRTLNRELFSAVEEGHLQKVKECLEKGADINARESDGSTALHLTVENGHTNIVQLLLKEGANIDSKNMRMRRH